MATQSIQDAAARIGQSAGRARQTAGQWRRDIARDDGGHERLAYGLGWFSIGLGLAEVAAPGAIARLTGVSERKTLIRGFGLREIASGVGILTNQRPAGWIWSRVGGDALDLSALGTALVSNGRHRGRTIAAIAAVAGVTALDVLCSERLSRSPETGYRAIRFQRAVAVNCSPEQAYQFWRNFHNLTRFMDRLESVHIVGENRTHWRARTPAGKTLEWVAETLEDRPNERIAWRSAEGSQFENSGAVRFEPAPSGRGTVVRVEMEYLPPAGSIGALAARLFGREPGQQLAEDLRRFKQIIETGEVVRSDASIHPGKHPARPSGAEEQS